MNKDKTLFRWYAVYTKPKKEYWAKENLENQNITTYLPLYKKTKRARERRIETISPFFPGYLFINTHKAQNIRSVRYTRGVIRIINDGENPIPVPEKVIEEIKSREDEKGLIRMNNGNFMPGQKVQILDGPFRGVSAIFERHLSEKDRVEVLINILQSSARVVLSIDSVA